MLIMGELLIDGKLVKTALQHSRGQQAETSRAEQAYT
jgi:hypothetical protein